MWADMELAIDYVNFSTEKKSHKETKTNCSPAYKKP